MNGLARCNEAVCAEVKEPLEKALTDGLLDVKRAESRVKRARGEDNG